MSTKTLMTVEEFAQMHTAETEDYELVDGELIPLPTGTPRSCRNSRPRWAPVVELLQREAKNWNGYWRS
jgi:Uma2 family endonuclease